MSTCLKRALARALAAMAFTLAAAGAANAAYIQADLTRVGGNTWDASFTVGEDRGQAVTAFSIYGSKVCSKRGAGTLTPDSRGRAGVPPTESLHHKH